MEMSHSSTLDQWRAFPRYRPHSKDFTDNFARDTETPDFTDILAEMMCDTDPPHEHTDLASYSASTYLTAQDPSPHIADDPLASLISLHYTPALTVTRRRPAPIAASQAHPIVASQSLPIATAQSLPIAASLSMADTLLIPVYSTQHPPSAIRQICRPLSPYNRPSISHLPTSLSMSSGYSPTSASAVSFTNLPFIHLPFTEPPLQSAMSLNEATSTIPPPLSYPNARNSTVDALFARACATATSLHHITAPKRGHTTAAHGHNAPLLDDSDDSVSYYSSNGACFYDNSASFYDSSANTSSVWNLPVLQRANADLRSHSNVYTGEFNVYTGEFSAPRGAMCTIPLSHDVPLREASISGYSTGDLGLGADCDADVSLYVGYGKRKKPHSFTESAALGRRSCRQRSGDGQGSKDNAAREGVSCGQSGMGRGGRENYMSDDRKATEVGKNCSERENSQSDENAVVLNQYHLTEASRLVEDQIARVALVSTPAEEWIFGLVYFPELQRCASD